MPKKITKNILTDVTQEKLEKLKEENPESVIVKLDCKHQNQGEGKCFDCGQPI